MRLDRKEMICGQPIKRVRDFLRRLSDREWPSETIGDFFATQPAETTGLIAAMIERGWIEESEHFNDEDGNPYYRCGENGARLRNARILKPIKRGRADELLAEALQRVREVNADPNLITSIVEVRVFGSYLSAAAELGDLDLAIRFRERETPEGDWIKASFRRACEAGRQSRSFFERLNYGELEVWRL